MDMITCNVCSDIFRPRVLQKGERLMNDKSIKKVAFLVNTVILFLVFGLMGFFIMFDITFLTYFSIPTAMIYIVGYFLIKKDRLELYVRMVYFWLTLYMGLTTLCLGYGYGFHLYCLSMIPIIFVTEYLSYKIEGKPIPSVKVSIAIAVFYLICTGYVSYKGPIYDRDQSIAAFFWIFNAMIVFGFLIYYSNYLIRLVIYSENKLKDMALRDRLTGLYNRHYMLNYLEGLSKDDSAGVLAMADIDDFKKINDVYGHNAGDMVLESVSDKMTEVCTGCEISRWGGEEFLMYIPYKDPFYAEDLLEKLRVAIKDEEYTFEDKKINVTLTLGMSLRPVGFGIDEWIQDVDNKLYIGKKSGKNCLIK